MAYKYCVLAGALFMFHASAAINSGSSPKAMEWQNAEKALQRYEKANAEAKRSVVAAVQANTGAKRSGVAQPIMDDAALQEAAQLKEATVHLPANNNTFLEMAAKPNAAGRGANEAPSPGHLRATGTQSEASATIAAETPQSMEAAMASWTPSAGSEEPTAMEKQLTDLMMGGGGALKGTGFTKSVAEISRLIKDDMIAKVLSAHDTNQKQLDKENKEIHECMATRTTQTQEANKREALYLKTSPLHQTCRAGEAGKLTEKNEVFNEMKDKERIKLLKCKEFAMIKKKYGDQQANGQIVKKGGSEEPEPYVRRITATICGELPLKPGKGGGGRGGFLDIFMHAKEECQTATTEWQGLVGKYDTVLKEYSDKNSACDSLQDQMDGAACKRAVQMKDACETYSECYMDRTRAHAETVKMVTTEEKDRKAEWRGLKRMQCLMKAFADGKVRNSEVSLCKQESHDTDHLTILYPKVPEVVICSIPKLYPSTPQYKLKEFATLPALARGKDEANECTGVEEINTKPAKNSPGTCKCERVTLNGPYSGGPLVKCTNCLDVRRSKEKNSCPEGTKLFSPASASDWKTVFQSAGDIRAPHFIIDVTIPKNGCGACKSKAMNSHTSQGSSWHTSDGSPWWLRSTPYAEPNGDGQPNCYMNVNHHTDENAITFNDHDCHYHSKSYYCQLKSGNYEPKPGSPTSCSCKPIVLTGSYSAGALIRCNKCLDVSKSLEKNSCPLGTKLFSPANSKDWKTFLESAKPLRSPSWIIDVTRPQNGCGGCTKKAMNSKSPAQMTWRTADGSPWWLRSSLYTEPNGDYQANCYMDLWKTPFSEASIMFNDGKCAYHADSYYCQPVKKHAEGYEEHQVSDEEKIQRAEEHQQPDEDQSDEAKMRREKIKDAQESSTDED